MSRSRKHHPIYKIGGGKVEKQSANRKLRREKFTLPGGKSALYKRFYPQYYVIDYRFFEKKPITEDVSRWEKYYQRK